ncbi:MAG: cysteine dioxygenase family protein [Opitutaceae bacterium]|nr:cysteine dioxygenase family protein [Opitutaceae bacterium]
MAVPATPSKLQPLLKYLDRLEARASIECLRELLATSTITISDLRDFVRFGPENYQRNLVASGPWYEILVICWRSGQRSPIHNHARSTCGLKVLAGVCNETVFEHSTCGQVVAVSTSEKHTGDICVSEDEDTHQVSNLQAPGQDLVTLHIYSPPLRAMQQFSITGGAEEWRPAVAVFGLGEGI